MPKIGEMMESKYLKADDVRDRPLLLTFQSFKRENVAMENQPPDFKWVAYFPETNKGLVLNATNLQLGARALGSDDTDDWLGRKIVAYFDPDVQMGGKFVGGIRLRAPKPAAAAEPSPARQAARDAGVPMREPGADEPPPPKHKPKFEDFEDDIPF